GARRRVPARGVRGVATGAARAGRACADERSRAAGLRCFPVRRRVRAEEALLAALSGRKRSRLPRREKVGTTHVWATAAGEAIAAMVLGMAVLAPVAGMRVA